MKQKILVIGGTGMLGHMVYHHLDFSGNYQMYNSVYRTKLNESSLICDVEDQEALKNLFAGVRPNVVINCIGALVRQSSQNPASAIYLNAYLPHLLVKHCNEIGAMLIHMSTDCVFSGKKGNYKEGDFRDADDIYGRSKALGEVFEEPHVTLRTSIIGPELKDQGEGLMNWFLNQQGIVPGYTRALWSGVTTLELAKVAEKVICEGLMGLYQVTNGEPISKYDLLKLFHKKFKSQVSDIVKDDEVVVDKTLRPSSRYDFQIPSYERMLTELTSRYDLEQHRIIK